MTKKFLLLLTLLILGLFCSSSFAQISVPGTPFSTNHILKSDPQLISMPYVDIDKLKEEDRYESQFKDIPPRFGFPFTVNYGMSNSGTYEYMPDGTRIWRLTIKCPSAFAVNLIFNKFYLPLGSSMFVYNREKNYVLGAFTNLNNSPERVFSTAPVKGDEITIEYNAPWYITEQPEINISTIVHVYKDIFKIMKDYGGSGACNRNVICPEGDPYRDQIRSVAMIIVGGTRWCSGSLLNNTRNDGTPFFMTANHCISGTPSTWVFMFKYEAPTCPNPGGDGPLTFSISGSTLLANNAFSDFCLVKLSSKPPTNYNVYYTGWNRSNVPATSGFGVHHPAGDVKKISFSTLPYRPATYMDSTSVGDSSHWFVHWTLIASTGLTPITEGGSSGSPLYDQNKLFVGQLHGGLSSCTAPSKTDYYGKFDRSWNYGTTPATRLRDWLDSLNTNVWYINGFDPNSGPLNAFNLQTPSASVTITSIPGSSTLISFTWDTASMSASYKWIFGTALPSRLLTMPVLTNNFSLTLGQLDALLAGLGVAQGDSISGSWDSWAFRNNPPANDSLKATNGPRAIKFKRYRPILSAFTLISPASGSRFVSVPGGTAPVIFNWNKSGQGLTYKVLFKTGASYSDPATFRIASDNGGVDSVLTMTTGQLDAILQSLGVALGDSVVGFWRVRAYTSSDSMNSNAPDRVVTFRRSLFSSLVWTGTLTATDPTFNRPNSPTPSNSPPTTLSGSQRGYKVTRFIVSNSGPYYIYSGAAFDNFIILYQNSFNPLSGLTNAIGGNDDTTGTFMPEFTGSLPRSAVNQINLNAGTNYYLVNTIYGTTFNAGNWKDSIYGPGIISIITSIQNTGNTIPTEYKLSQNYPNPFNPTTMIDFAIPKTTLVKMKIYDMLGREVMDLVNQKMTAGYYKVDFNGSNLASGVYIYKLETSDFKQVKKMMLIK